MKYKRDQSGFIFFPPGPDPLLKEAPKTFNMKAERDLRVSLDLIDDSGLEAFNQFTQTPNTYMYQKPLVRNVTFLSKVSTFSVKQDDFDEYKGW